jgi:hypothetical protein
MAKNPNFNNERYSAVEIGPEGQSIGFQDGDLTTVVKDPKTGKPISRIQSAFNFSATDSLANQTEAVISLKHIPSGQEAFFKAFITTFNDSFSPSYGEETVFGRTDPIYTFKNTTRNITLNWKIPAETYSEAYENLGNVQKIARFVYPNYTNLGDASTISQTPIVRLKVMNLLTKTKAAPKTDDAEMPARQRFVGYRSSADPDQGAMGVIKSLTISHNIENPDQGGGVLYAGTNTVLPKLIEVNMSFDVIHDSVLGWRGRRFNGNATTFPYGVVEIDQELVSAFQGKPTPYNEFIQENILEDREQELADQARADAAARYGTMGGKARFNKDMKRIDRLAGKDNLSTAQQNRLDYLRSARDGQILLNSDEAQANSAAEADGVDPAFTG